MPEITLPYDLKDVKRTEDSETIPKGLYLMEVVKGTYMEAKDDKQAQIAITLRVLDAEKVELKSYIGAQFTEYLSLSAAAGWKVGQFTDALYGRQTEGRKLNTDKWIGKKLAVRTMIDNYGGNEKTKADRFMNVTKFRAPSAEGAADPMDAPAASTSANGAAKSPPPAPAADDEVAI